MALACVRSFIHCSIFIGLCVSQFINVVVYFSLVCLSSLMIAKSYTSSACCHWIFLLFVPLTACLTFRICACFTCFFSGTLSLTSNEEDSTKCKVGRIIHLYYSWLNTMAACSKFQFNCVIIILYDIGVPLLRRCQLEVQIMISLSFRHTPK